MGGKASKQLKETALGQCTLHENGATAVICDEALSPSALEGIKGKSGAYKDADGNEIITFKDHGMLKKHTAISIGGKVHGYVIGVKKGMSSGESHVLRDAPSYDGQEPVDARTLEKFGLREDATLYVFAKIESRRKSMTTNTAAYSLAAGPAEWREAYAAEKLSSVNFHCVVTAGGVPVAKASQAGITFYCTVDVAAGVDLAACLLTEQSTFSPDGATAGALAGAGVT